MSFSKILTFRSFSTSQLKASVIKNVAVIGGGLMGSGVSQVSYNCIMNLFIFFRKVRNYSN